MSINPQKNSIMDVFSKNKQYFLDFYQRDYQWKRVHIEKLLEDLFYRFKLEYKADLDVNPDTISQFDWYYLNAYVTNDYKGTTYIVDGQQRLTSLTLILIKLYHLTVKFESDKTDLIKEQIMGAGLSGYTYWMGYGNRKDVLEDLFKNQKQTLQNSGDHDISIINMYENYKNVSRVMDDTLQTKHILDSFILYFLTRVQLVNIQIQDTKDVPMVFEVINDRGERLLPYEVLKGKLLGQIDKNDIDQYYDIWQKHIHALQIISEKDVDDFFRFYFQAKFADSRAENREFDGDYHKTVYEPKWNNKIRLKNNLSGVKEFISKELDFFAGLYLKIRKGASDPKNYPYLYFNNLNDLDRQYRLVLSACQTNDPDENEKIQVVSKSLDRYFSLLQLNGAYDSNRFTESISALATAIRNKSLTEIEAAFNQQLLMDLSEAKETAVTTPYEWSNFSNVSRINLPYRFTKYFFARIDHFIAEFTKDSAESYDELVMRTGYKNGYQVEHILAYNEENLALFDHNEEIFNLERNKLGAIVLLKGRDNNSSNNESYAEKLKIYATRRNIWNKTLSEDFYHANPNLVEFAKAHQLIFKPYKTFKADAINERQRLLFELVKKIWL